MPVGAPFKFDSPLACTALPPFHPPLAMTVVGDSRPSGNYAVNVRCVQIIRPSSHPSFSNIVETAQRRIMLAQLVTDEAKPGSREKWLRIYTDKLSALGIDMEDGAITAVDRSSIHGTLADVIVYILSCEGWNAGVTELVKTALESLGNGENQSAMDAFNRAAAVQDVAGGTAAFEIQTLSTEDSGNLRIHSCWFSLASKATVIQDIFSLQTTSGDFSIQYRISSGLCRSCL
ncbi:hypothetical protein BC827DRAFT_1211030 [Russula dissimulans]|nr:hypothetical protein BC827DRAFT_1211030 [Russula dissimulans]